MFLTDNQRNFLYKFAAYDGMENTQKKNIEEIAELQEQLARYQQCVIGMYENPINFSNLAEEAAHTILTTWKLMVRLGEEDLTSQYLQRAYEHLELMSKDPVAEEERWRNQKLY